LSDKEKIGKGRASGVVVESVERGFLVVFPGVSRQGQDQGDVLLKN